MVEAPAAAPPEVTILRKADLTVTLVTFQDEKQRQENKKQGPETPPEAVAFLGEYRFLGRPGVDEAGLGVFNVVRDKSSIFGGALAPDREKELMSGRVAIHVPGQAVPYREVGSCVGRQKLDYEAHPVVLEIAGAGQQLCSGKVQHDVAGDVLYRLPQFLRDGLRAPLL